jgi:hypothetical protein
LGGLPTIFVQTRKGLTNLSAINHPQLRNLNDLWAENCLERSMPSRRYFDVIEFKQLMGNLAFWI